MKKITCYYCNKEKTSLTFVIGASVDADWVINYGTGNMSCPNCWETGQRDGKQRINNHIKSVRGEKK